MPKTAPMLTGTNRVHGHETFNKNPPFAPRIGSLAVGVYAAVDRAVGERDKPLTTR
jgi:hypothetical protein